MPDKTLPVPFAIEGEFVVLDTSAIAPLSILRIQSDVYSDAERYRFLRFAYTGDCQNAYVCEDYLDQQVDSRANDKPSSEEWDAHIDAAIKLAVAAGVWVSGV